MKAHLLAAIILTLIGFIFPAVCNADFKPIVSTAHTSDINQFSLSSDGKRLASASEEPDAATWPAIESTRSYRTLSGLRQEVTVLRGQPER